MKMLNGKLLRWCLTRFCIDVGTSTGSFTWNLESCRIYRFARIKTIQIKTVRTG
ncbi:hypothetical protein Gotur_012347 [Gossypium turneri]